MSIGSKLQVVSCHIFIQFSDRHGRLQNIDLRRAFLGETDSEDMSLDVSKEADAINTKQV